MHESGGGGRAPPPLPKIKLDEFTWWNSRK